MQTARENFGVAEDKEVFLYTLTNAKNMVAKITNYGGILVSLQVPDCHGKPDDVVLGFDNFTDYQKNSPYFGAIIGRYANRIARGRFSINNVKYQLALNNGDHHLHGGHKGFDKVVWNLIPVMQHSQTGVQLSYRSAHMEEGYPGTLDVVVEYTLNDKNELKIKYSAITDKLTHLNLTHHSYFNLAGMSGRDILGHFLWIDADRYTLVTNELIPTGEVRSVKHTPLDFTRAKTVGSRIKEVGEGYDHNFVLNKSGNLLSKVALLIDPVSGRRMEVETTEPGLQFYSGNQLAMNIRGKNKMRYRNHSGLCLEAQHYPDTPNQPGFPSTLLRPGDKYEQTTIYRFGIEK